MRSVLNSKIGIIGLGYVGLPLAVEFSKKYDVIGYDINISRIEELSMGIDRTDECDPEDIQQLKNISFTNNLDVLKKFGCDVYIVTVPTPIDQHKRPDLTPLISASKAVGHILNKNDIVIYESTVYPGATELDCVPILEEYSQLKYNYDFFVGYSPERINPGDKDRRLKNIVKVTSGSTDEISKFVDELYNSIVEAGTFRASSIMVAEASKIIENTQRDVNIALMNEFSIIFDKLGISTHETLEAASSKWNFIKLHPGMVGGHCIGVDPYYLVHKSQELGYIPDIIKAAREINDGMSSYYANKYISSLVKKKTNFKDFSILLLGVTFKANCPDIRNSKVVDLYAELVNYGIDVHIYDPLANPNEVFEEFNIRLISDVKEKHFSGIIKCVNHDVFAEENIKCIIDGCENFMQL